MDSPTHNKLHEIIIKNGRPIKATRHQVIQTSDTQRSFHLVKSGYIKRYLIKNDGSIGVDLVYGPGDVFSLTLIFTGLYGREILDSPETYYYEAVEDAELYAIPIDDLARFVEAEPILYRDLLSEAGKRMTYETHGLENMSMKNSYKRVAHQLVYYAKQFGEDIDGEIVIIPPLTHQDIADILNLTRETVSTCMVSLRRKKFIKSSKSRQVIVPDIEKLEQEAFN